MKRRGVDHRDAPTRLFARQLCLLFRYKLCPQLGRIRDEFLSLVAYIGKRNADDGLILVVVLVAMMRAQHIGREVHRTTKIIVSEKQPNHTSITREQTRTASLMCSY